MTQIMEFGATFDTFWFKKCLRIRPSSAVELMTANWNGVSKNQKFKNLQFPNESYLHVRVSEHPGIILLVDQ